MPARKHKLMAAAEPKYGRHFDPWHSGASGHQRAESRLPVVTGWRESRSMKLSHQLKSGGTGGIRIFDNVERGLESWDKAKTLEPGDIKSKSQCSVVDMIKGKDPGMSMQASHPYWRLS